MSQAAERRSSTRIETRQRVWCEGDDFTVFARLANLSEGGAFVRTAVPLDRGAQARLLWTPDGGAPVIVVVEVVWTRSSRGADRNGPGAGLRFLNFEAGKDTLAEVLHRG